MIEINLLPGAARKKVATTRASIDYAALFAGLSGKFGNPYVIGGVVLSVLVVGVVGWMFVGQARAAKVAVERLQKGVEDSTRYAGIVAERLALEAKRDTLLRQVNLIRSIDEDRYIWPHVLDEVSRALPAYTWITSLQFSGPPAGAANVVALPKAPPVDPNAKAVRPKPLPTAIPKDVILIRMVGKTVDIQALTRFMRDLAASPFFTGVAMERTDPGSDQGKEVYTFNLQMNYNRPDTTALHRLPLVITVR
jgi:Tfp pilus assembly protein PilN